MSTKKVENKKNDNNHEHGGVVAPTHCRFEACKSKTKKFGFCQEHFEMYMAGVIRGDGAKPVDFEKKLELYLASQKVA
ncbi:MAG: hypothetical protein R3A80_13615 [Bdellovibrionota bacterium]